MTRVWGPLLRLALFFHPRSVRDRFGEAMVADLEEGLGERRGRGRLAYGVRVLVDVAWSGAMARWRIRRGRVAGTKTTGGGRMGELATDLRMAARGLRRTPGFTLAAVLVLALGVGANASVFSAVKEALLAPPPFPEPDRLVLLDLADSSRAQPAAPRATPWSYPKLQVLLGQEDLPVEAVGGYAPRPLTLTSEGPAVRIQAEVVTPGYLDALEVEPAAGRLLTPDDDTGEAAPVVVLSHGLWMDRFGGRPGVVGGDVELEGRPVTVVGVAPAGFQGLTGSARAWVPVHTGGLLLTPVLVRAAGAHWMRGVARLRPGVPVEEMDARLRALGAAVGETWPPEDPDVVPTAMATSLVEARMNPQARRSLILLGTAAGLLLLVACANLAGLLLARGEARSRETAVRLALGSGGWRVLRSSLAEGLVLGVLGAAAAGLVSVWGAGLLARAWPARFVEGSWNVRFVSPEGMGADGAVLLFSAAVAVVAGLVFGALSGLAHLRPDHLAGLRSSLTVDRGTQGARKALVAVEVALALVLVLGAGLLLRSLGELQGVEAGFTARNVVVFQLGGRPPAGVEPADFTESLLARFREIPGVEEASAGCAVPAAAQCWIGGVREAGARSWPSGQRPSVGLHPVEHRYFATLGVPLLEGRTFDDTDRADGSPVAVLSRRAADLLFPDGEALGATVGVTASATPEDGPLATVVGIVGDVRYGRPEEGFMPEVYLSHRQEGGSERVILRTAGDPLAVIPDVRRLVASTAPDVPVVDVRDLRAIEAAGTAETRVLGSLLGAFALLTLLLAATGVWAVVAWAVQRRTREVGLRMALGAPRTSVVGLVVREGLGPVVAGLLAGAAGAWGAGRLLDSVLFQVRASDPVSWGAAALLLTGVGVLAAWLPARRATRVDPMEALRAE